MDNSKDDCILKFQDSSLEFTGETCKNQVSCKYLVGIAQKDSQKILLKEAQVYNISGKLQFQAQNTKRKINRESLGSEFGSKKKRKEITSRNINSIKQVSGNSIQEIMSENTVTPQNSEISSFLLLKPNLETRLISQVYSLDEIVPVGFLKDLNLENLRNLFKEMTQNSTYFKDKEIGKDGELIKIGIYLEILKTFYKRKDREITLILPGTNEEVMEILIKKFTEYSNERGGRYRFTSILKDLILAEIGILALHLDNFNVSIQNLIQDLGISAGKMIKIYKELGVRINTVKKEKMAILSLPLSFTPKSSPSR